jgi:ABC-type phosphate transport system substrate-binding protein
MRLVAAIAVTLAVLVTVLGGPSLAQSPAGPPVYVVIVNPNNPAGSADRQFLEDAFLKKVTRWPNDEVVRPSDLVANSSVRRKFSDEVLHRSVEAVKGYWQQRIFSGRDVPPPEFDTDDEVVKFVLKHDGGVGYVSGTANLDGTKVLSVK